MEKELQELQQEAAENQTVPGDAGVAKLRDALDTRNAQKKDAQAVGASSKALCKKPAAKGPVFKKPGAKLKDTCDPQSNANSIPKTKAKAQAKKQPKMKVKSKDKKKRELSMSRSCVYSRAYHKASQPLLFLFKVLDVKFLISGS